MFICYSHNCICLIIWFKYFSQYNEIYFLPFHMFNHSDYAVDAAKTWVTYTQKCAWTHPV